MDYPTATYKVKFSYKGHEQIYYTTVAFDTRKVTEENAFHNAVIQMIKKLGLSFKMVEVLKIEIRMDSPIHVDIVKRKI